MKNLKILFTFICTALLLGCSADDDSQQLLENADAPRNISALFTITQDNTGLVTIAPHGEGVVSYEVNFGDGTSENAMIAPGSVATHTYTEGQYDVIVTGVGINGKTTAITQPLTVSFVAPENVEVSIATVVGNPFQVNVTASADYETFFEVTYGEDPGQTPVQFMEGETVTHTYAETGTYTVTVTAYSGGAASTTVTEEVTITNPLLLPITFENSNLNYNFIDFGNASTSIVDNPDISGINVSARVGQFIKNPGAETWAGTTITLDEPIDFSEMESFRMKVWSPAVGVTVKFKLENLDNADINYEVDAVTTVANEWEYLTYNFAGADLSQSYSKVILFFNFDVNGNGDTYYFDDITQSSDVESFTLPITFESPTLEYTLNGFGGAGGGKIANPHQSGINTSANVGHVVKAAGAETWAGVAMTLSEPIDFSALQKVKIKVWSPQAGITVLFKLENSGNTSIATELPATTTVANQWEELEYDFTGINNANNYQNIVLFFDFDAVGTGATYYFDDVQLSN